MARHPPLDSGEYHGSAFPPQAGTYASAVSQTLGGDQILTDPLRGSSSRSNRFGERRWKFTHVSMSPRLRNDAQVGFQRLPTTGEFLFRLFVRDRGHNDHIFPVFPIDRRRHLMTRSQL